MAIDALGTALSGLRAAQQGIDVVSSNIANANTDGYTAKKLSQQNAVVGNEGLGVRTGEISRYVDKAVQRDYRIQLGAESFHSTRTSYLQRIMTFHGSSDQEKNVGAQLGKLYQSFVELSGTPESTTLQQSAVTQAATLAKTLNNYSKMLNDLRNDVQGVISTEVTTLNESLRQIADVNKRIQALQGVGKSTAALEDQRDILVKDVASQIEVSYYTNGDGTLVLQTKAGQILADNIARTLEFSNNTATPGATYPGTLSGLVIREETGNGVDIAADPIGGKLGALFALRDKELPSYGAQADELAYKMAVRFNDQNLRLFTNANGTLPANNPAAYNGFAGEIQVNALVVATPGLLQQGTTGPGVNPGSNAVINNILDYTFGRYKNASGTPNEPFDFTNVGADGSISYNILGDPNATLEQFAQSMLESQASDYTLAKNVTENEQIYTQEIQKRLLDGSSVNTDLELTRMIELQRGYSASAKMISTLDELFRSLLNAI